MRKITSEIIDAWSNGREKTISNTYTDGKAIFLHGNKIAEFKSGDIYITLAGWSTATTRERLNGIPGVHVTQKRGVQYLNGKDWGGEWTKI